MPNRIITAAVTGETIKLSNKTAGAAGSFNAVSLSLTFDSAWDGTTKKLYFFDAYGNNAVYRLLTTDLLVDGAYVVPIPAEPLAYAGEMTITIRGIDFATDGTTAERIIMSASTTMKVLPAIAPASDVAPVEPTPTQAEQLQGEIDDIKGDIAYVAEIAGTIESSVSAASASASAAATSATEAEASQSAAANSAAAAAASQTAAKTSETNAKASETAAESAQTNASASASTASKCATDAQSAQTAAESARDAAVTAKTAAETARDAASSSKTAAATSESNAASSAAAAAASEAAAATSETNAAASATAAANSAAQAAQIVGGDFATREQAQDYAATAKSEAISTAASDATAKANTAEANAKSYTDMKDAGKADKKVPSAEGNIATLDSTGNLADSGKTLAELQTELILDSTPTLNSTNPITSGGVYTALEGKQDKLTAGANIIISGNTISSTDGLPPTITVTAPTGSTVTAVSGSTTLTATESSGTWVFNIPAYGTWTINATLGTQSASGTVVVDTVKQYAVEISYAKIYGVSWSGGPSTAWTRTDDAAGFPDPVPALSNGNGSSPFDNCYPWNGMVKESRTGGVMVKIPKFWFKWTKSGSTLKLQIADKAVDGFSVSPAHMDRGDGKGERDYVYVGRYHCNSSYLSATGSSPISSITRDTARSSIHANGSTIWQMDYAMRLTIWMLMLVEFADNDFQAKIGYGCGDGSAAGAMGYTDSMTYHTGTTQSARTTYGLGTQYRYIEGLWDNVRDWMDGCYYSSSGMSVIKNPANFSDTANGTVIGTPTSGFPSAMSLSSVSGFEWCIYPTASAGSTTTYFPDSWYFNASNPCLYAGGYYYQSLYYGAFCVDFTNASDAGAGIGCRLQELP